MIPEAEACRRFYESCGGLADPAHPRLRGVHIVESQIPGTCPASDLCATPQFPPRLDKAIVDAVKTGIYLFNVGV